MSPLSPTPSMLDADQCIREAYDDASESLKVTLVGDAIPEGGGIEVSISSANDSIAIGNVAGQLMTVNSDGSINVDVEGLTTLKTSQVIVGTSPVQLTPSPLSNRSSLSIKAITTTSADIVYIGSSNAVSATTGYFLFDGDSLSMDLTPAQQIWAIGTSANQIVAVAEIGG